MARPERFELPTTKFVAWYSIQLSYGRVGTQKRAANYPLSPHRRQRKRRAMVAEREGFEPSIRLLTRYSLSRRAPSASRAPLRNCLKLLHRAVSRGIHTMRSRIVSRAPEPASRSARINVYPVLVKSWCGRASASGRLVPGFVGLGGCGTRPRLMLLLDALVNLFAMHRDILGCGDADAHLVALHAQHRDGYLVADHQGFPNAAGQNQHDGTPFVGTGYTRSPH